MAKTLVDLDVQAKLASATNQIIASNAITNVKVDAAAAIAFSKLATLTSGNILLGNGSNVATSTAVSGDISLSNTGVAAISSGVIVDADINASAAISFSKLASLADGNILVGNGSGVATSVNPSGDIDVSNAGVFSINSGVIVDADVNASAAIATTKLADAANFLLRNTSNTISNTIRYTYAGTQTFTADGDLVTKGYVDGVATGLDVKASVRAATTANITLSATQTVDGVALAVGNRVLVKDQSTGANNGIYVVAAGAWTRSTDADNSPSGEVTSGLFTFVEEGTISGGKGYVLVTADPITLGSTSLSFSQFSDSGAIVAGAGLAFSGLTLNVGDAGKGVQVNADDLELSASEGSHSTGGLEASANAWQFKIKLDGTTGGNNANVIKLTANGTSVGIDNSTITVSGGNLQVPAGVVNAGTLDSLDSLDFLRATASSSLATTNTLTVTSGAFVNFAVETGLKIGGTSLTTTIAELNLLGSIATREVPTGAVDGVNDTFTLANSAFAGSEHVYVNGILQDVGGSNDYTISGAVITFVAGAIPQTGSKVRVSYRY